MKMADIIVALIGKRGVISETKNIDMEIDIPESVLKIDNIDKSNKITIRFKAENCKITIEEKL